jgi:DNA-binding MarR family transcriptional regulator
MCAVLESLVLAAVATASVAAPKGPTIREIAVRAGLSRSYTDRVLKALKRKGHIEHERATHRSIKLTVIGADVASS